MKTPDPSLLSVSYTQNSQKSAAQAFAGEYELPCQPPGKVSTKLCLNFDELGLQLLDLQNKMTLQVDFIGGSLGHRRKYGGGKGQTIARAVGIKQGKPMPEVLDATAGLGKDSYVLACLGCSITMLERSPVVAALLRDGIDRASLNIDFQEIIDRGFSLKQSDALSYIEMLDDEHKPDVIYLDPMYPERKKSASVKKNMQLLQQLLGQDMDTHNVLSAALQKAKQRVVVKRPKGAPVLDFEVRPTLHYESKSTRYDVYIVNQPQSTQ